MPKYRVRQGECISSIAYKFGFFEKTIWNHPENAQLKDKRKNPNVLYAGDIVFVPEKREKVESGTTEQKHIFRRKGVPVYLKVRLFDEAGNPRASLPYILCIDGRITRDITDEDGYVEQQIPPNAKQGKLIVGEGEEMLDYVLAIGELDPIDFPSGVQGRLENLGFGGDIEEVAVASFQRRSGLEVTGTLDDVTLKKLKKVHDDRIGDLDLPAVSMKEGMLMELAWGDSGNTEEVESVGDNEKLEGNSDAEGIQI